jgi:hypothetical protein
MVFTIVSGGEAGAFNVASDVIDRICNQIGTSRDDLEVDVSIMRHNDVLSVLHTFDALHHALVDTRRQCRAARRYERFLLQVIISLDVRCERRLYRTKNRGAILPIAVRRCESADSSSVPLSGLCKLREDYDVSVSCIFASVTDSALCSIYLKNRDVECTHFPYATC